MSFTIEMKDAIVNIKMPAENNEPIAVEWVFYFFI